MDNNLLFPTRHRAIFLNFTESFDFSLLDDIEIDESRLKAKNPYDLEKYIMDDGNISGEAMSQALFPAYKTGYFLSHSHDDEELTRVLAHYMTYLNNSVFFDEDFWHSADALIKTLNSKVVKRKCKCGTEFVDLRLCLRNASLAYVLLCTALQEVIRKSHTFIFLGTSQSIYSRTNQTTLSPWLYYELKTINDILSSEQMIKVASESVQPKIELPLMLKRFEKVEINNIDQLNKWLYKLQ